RTAQGAQQDHHHGYARPAGRQACPTRGPPGKGPARGRRSADRAGNGARGHPSIEGRNVMTDPTRLPLYVLIAIVGTVVVSALLLFTILRRVRAAEFVIFILKTLRRNVLRTTLTALAIFVLVLMISFIWSVLSFMDRVLTEREGMQKAIVTERFQ